MKTRHLAGVVVLLLILAASSLCNAETLYDISRYMPWQAGQWTLIQDYDPLDTSCPGCYLQKEELSGVAVSKSGIHTILSYYRDDGNPGVWMPAWQEKFKRSTDFLTVVALNLDGKWWTLKPPLAIPRALKLNEPFYYSGSTVNGEVQGPIGLVLIIAKAGFSVTTPAGTFTNCLQTQWVWSRGAETGDIETKVLARGVGEVKVWSSSMWREKNGFAAEAFKADTEYKEAIEKGLSNPPFP